MPILVSPFGGVQEMPEAVQEKMVSGVAAKIRSAAERDARILQADASVKAAAIEAQSRVEAAQIYGRAYASSPQLYNLLRSLDTLGTMVNPGTKIILRTDAAPFRVLVDGPPNLDPKAGSTP